MATKLLPQAQLGVKKTTISASVLRELKPEKKIGIEKGSREESYIQKLETIKEFFLKRYKNDVLTLKEQRKRLLAQRRRRQEESIEQNKEAKKKSKSALNPRLRTPSFFKNIFSSIGNFFLYLAGGLLFNSFIGLEKSLAGIVKTLEVVGQGIQIFANAIGQVTNFIDSAYKGYDKMVKQISDITGLSQEQINDFSSKFNKLINGTLIASMIILRGLPGFIMARNLRGGRPRITRGVGTRRPFLDRFRGNRRLPSNTSSTRVTGVSRSRVGVTGDVIGKFRRSPLTNLSRKALVRTLGKTGSRNLLRLTKNFITPIVKRIPFIGALIDFALNVFVFKEPPGRAAFKAIGAGLGLWIGSIIGSVIPVAGNILGGLAGGASGDILGGMIYDSIFGDKVSQSSLGLDTQAAYEETIETTNNIIQPIVFA